MVSLVVSNLVEKVNQTPVIFNTDEVNLNLKVIAMVNIYSVSLKKIPAPASRENR